MPKVANLLKQAKQGLEHSSADILKPMHQNAKFGGQTWLFAGLLVLFASPVLEAQTGSLGGQIFDAQRATVAGAQIQALNILTGENLRVASSEAGIYLFPNLPPGAYTISAEKSGFKRVLRSNVKIFASQRQTIDWHLEVGDTSQQLEIVAAPTLLDSNSSERGQTLTPRMYETLPRWSGGLQDPSAFLSFMAAVNVTSEVSIAGSVGRAREQLIDGGSNVIPESGGTVFTRPSAESFQEVRLLTGNYSAEFGRVGGGIEILTTKSGTNQWHGTLAYHLRRDIWNAAGWTVNQNRNNPAGFRPKDRTNASSGGTGGPVWIPRLYDGRNKTFFYFSSDHDLQPRGSQAVLNTVAAAPLRLGDFSQIPQLIFDPATTTVAGPNTTRMPFPRNTIPQSRFSRISTNILPFLPAPTGEGLNNNYSFVNSTELTNHVWAVKFDHALNDRNRFAYFHSGENQLADRTLDFSGPLGTGGQVSQRPLVIRASHTLILGPAMVLQSSYAYSRTAQLGSVPAQTGFASRAGFPGLSGSFDVTPRIQFAPADGYTAWGSTPTNGVGQDNHTHHLSQSLSWVKGKHVWKGGWDLRLLQTLAPRTGGNGNGTYSFARAQTASPAATATTGNSLASFLLGAPDSATLAVPPVEDFDIRYRYSSFFFQDEFKLHPRLTLNLGLRYEVPINWHMPSMSSVSLTALNPGAGNLPGAYVFPGKGPGRLGVTRFWPTDFSNIGPRLGFAYQPGTRTVLRGGFGIVYEATGNGGCACNVGSSSLLQANSNGFTAPFQWDNGIPVPAGFVPPPNLSPTAGIGQAVDYLGPTFGHAPHIFHWSFGFQREIGRFLIEAEYAGNRGFSLNSTVDLNQVNPSFLRLGNLLRRPISAPDVVAAGFSKPYASFPNEGTLAQALRPFPQYLSVLSRNSGHGRTWYDSASLKVQRRVGNWQFSTSYVRSKSLSLLTFRQTFTQTQVYAQDMYNLAQPKSYLPFDLPNVFNFISTYDLPFGRGQRFLGGANRLWNTLAGNWTIAQTHNYRSGGLLPVNCINTLGNGVLFTLLRACDSNPVSVLTGQSRTSLDPNQPDSRYFNGNAFSIPGQFAFGSSAPGHGRFRQPPVFTDNISITKQLVLLASGNDRTGLRLQFTANAFNALNRTNFGANGFIGNPNFGRATAPQNSPRLITLGLRVQF